MQEPLSLFCLHVTLSTAVRAGDKTINVEIFFFIPKTLMPSISFAIVGLALFRSIILVAHWSLTRVGVMCFKNRERVKV